MYLLGIGEKDDADGDRGRKAQSCRVKTMAGENLLRDSNTIAVVGLSGRRSRPSYGVSEYMQSRDIALSR